MSEIADTLTDAAQAAADRIDALERELDEARSDLDYSRIELAEISAVESSRIGELETAIADHARGLLSDAELHDLCGIRA